MSDEVATHAKASNMSLLGRERSACRYTYPNVTVFSTTGHPLIVIVRLHEVRPKLLTRRAFKTRVLWQGEPRGLIRFHTFL